MKLLTTLITLLSLLTCFMPKHEHGVRIVSDAVSISALSAASHQHASGECDDFESDFCHNSHCVYIVVKNVSIQSMDFPEFYNSSIIKEYDFSFKSFLLRPPIA